MYVLYSSGSARSSGGRFLTEKNGWSPNLQKARIFQTVTNPKSTAVRPVIVDRQGTHLIDEAAEEWRSIPGDELYDVSDWGRVRWEEDHPWNDRHIHQSVQDSGHHSVYLKPHRQNRYVHRLVLTAFDRPPKEGEVGRHLDDDPANNRIENLAWGTLSENAHDRARNQRKEKP